MDDKLAELKRRITLDAKRSQDDGEDEMVDGMMVALFEIEHIDEPYAGEEDDDDV